MQDQLKAWTLLPYMSPTSTLLQTFSAPRLSFLLSSTGPFLGRCNGRSPSSAMDDNQEARDWPTWQEPSTVDSTAQPRCYSRHLFISRRALLLHLLSSDTVNPNRIEIRSACPFRALSESIKSSIRQTTYFVTSPAHSAPSLLSSIPTHTIFVYNLLPHRLWIQPRSRRSPSSWHHQR